jgi:hypothetical protein
MIRGLSPAATRIGRKKIAKTVSSTVVEQLPHDSKVVGLSPAATRIGRDENGKNVASGGSTVV